MAFNEYPRDYRVYKIISYVVGGLALAVVVGLLLGFLVKFLWNVTLAELFEFPRITFWQAFGLFVLAKLFFGFGGGGGASDQRKKKKARSPRVEPESRADMMDDESFRRFWEEEGREAYEAFRGSRGEGRDDDADVTR